MFVSTRAFFSAGAAHRNTKFEVMVRGTSLRVRRVGQSFLVGQSGWQVIVKKGAVGFDAKEGNPRIRAPAQPQ